MSEAVADGLLRCVREQLERLREKSSDGTGSLGSIWPEQFAELEQSLDQLADHLTRASGSGGASRALDPSEARLRQVIDLVPHMIFAKNRQGGFLLANKAHADVYGLSVDELLGQRHRAVHGDAAEVDHMLSDDLDVIESGRSKFIPQEEFTDHQGNRRILQTIKIPFTASGSNEPAILGVAIDITERVRAEQALRKVREELEERVKERTSRLAAANKRLLEEIAEREQTEEAFQRSEQRARALLDIVPDMIFRISGDGTFLDFRADVTDDLLVAPETIIGRNISALPMSEAVKEGLRQTMARAIKTGELLAYEYDLEIDGKSGSFEARFVKSGAVESVCIVRNITERKRVEERTQQQQAELAHVARVSTMGEMATGLAHELNQPLASIGNYATACLGRLRSVQTAGIEELREWVAEIEDEAIRAGEIIRRMRFLVSKRRPMHTTLDVAALIQDVVALVDSEARTLEARVEVDICPDLPRVEGDPVQVQQVVLNLVRNGLEAMQEASGTDRMLSVRCQVLSSDKPGGSEPEWVEIAITDRGAGIPVETVDRVLDPFFTTKPEGMGMGLPISRSIIDAHGGRLEFSPNPEGGTIFRVVLPVFRG